MGSIRIANLNDMKVLQQFGIHLDEIYFIVRSLKNPDMPLYNGQMYIHLPELSPSRDLFYSYLRLRNAGQWNKNTFFTQYAPTFLKQMHETVPRAWLNRLFKDVTKHGKDIALVCFCKDEELCHRSIVGGLLQGACLANSKDVKLMNMTGNIEQYSFYYDMYRGKEVRL